MRYTRPRQIMSRHKNRLRSYEVFLFKMHLTQTHNVGSIAHQGNVLCVHNVYKLLEHCSICATVHVAQAKITEFESIFNA